MRFIPIDELPELNYHLTKPRTYKWIQCLDKFMAMNTKNVEVVYDPGEYVNTSSAYSALKIAIGRFRYPIKTAIIGKRVFMSRTDI